ncbi:MAG: PKD domain-containing protein, partial [Candidatus Hydrogenedentota bacterium]
MNRRRNRVFRATGWAMVAAFPFLLGQSQCPGTVEPPTAAFSADVRSGPGPLAVTFVDESTAGSAPIDSWFWDLGDGQTSTEQSPVHSYLAAGVFTVSLTVSASGSDSIAAMPNYITVFASGPTAAFSAEAAQGVTPFGVSFADESLPGTSPITMWAWDFGDPESGEENSSSEPSPEHVYATAGIFSVQLTVATAVASDSMIGTGYITVHVTLEQALSDLMDPDVEVDAAATEIEQTFGFFIESQGLEPAMARLDEAMAGAVVDADSVLRLLERSDQLEGRIVDAPLIVNDGTLPDDPPNVPAVCAGTTVLFVNGMNVPYPGFVASVRALNEAVSSDARLQAEDIRVSGIYQRSATDAQQSFFGGVICPIVGDLTPVYGAQLEAVCRDSGGFLIDLG